MQRPNTRVPPELWVTIVDLRTGSPVYDGERVCPRCALGKCKSLPILDSTGYHAIACATSEGFFRRHNHLRDNLAAYLGNRSLGLAPRTEWLFPEDADNL